MRVMFDGGILDELGMEDSARVLMALLRALVEANVRYLKNHPKTPHPYRARIRYRRESKGHERWKSMISVFRTWIRFVLTFILPIAVMTSYPALAVLGRLSAKNAGLAWGVSLGLFAGTRVLWKWSVRHYSSASS